MSVFSSVANAFKEDVAFPMARDNLSTQGKILIAGSILLGGAGVVILLKKRSE